MIFSLGNVGLLKRHHAPRGTAICRVSPHEFTLLEPFRWVFCHLTLLECSGVMCAATWSKNIVDNAVTWKVYDLFSCLSVVKRSIVGDIPGHLRNTGFFNQNMPCCDDLVYPQVSQAYHPPCSSLCTMLYSFD